MKLTADMLAKARIVARGYRIRELDRLMKTYGGDGKQWLKKSTPVLDAISSGYEIHWYEHPQVGKVELKRKEVQE